MLFNGSVNPSVIKALKRRLLLCAMLAICGLLLFGCSSEDGDDADNPGDGSSSSTGNPGGQADGSGPVYTDETVTAENISQFVTLGQYKGIYYDETTADPVTEADIDEYILDGMSQEADWAQVTDRAVIRGDTVIIDYEGFINGVAFEGGTAYDADLEIGSGRFIPGFEEQIIGRNIGDEFDIHVTFPTDYHAPEMAGQPAVFKIRLNEIYAEVVPELTDEYVQAYLGMDTVAEFRAALRVQLEQEREKEAEDNVSYQIWSAIVGNSTFHKYPQAEIDTRMDMSFMELEYMASMYGMDVEDLIAYFTNGMSVPEFIEYELRPSAINDVEHGLVLRAIAAQEGIFISEEEFSEAVSGFVVEYGYDDEEHFLSIIGDHAVHIVLLSDRVTEIVMSSAIKR